MKISEFLRHKQQYPRYRVQLSHGGWAKEKHFDSRTGILLVEEFYPGTTFYQQHAIPISRLEESLNGNLYEYTAEVKLQVTRMRQPETVKPPAPEPKRRRHDRGDREVAPWTPELLDLVRQRWAEGRTLTQIAAELCEKTGSPLFNKNRVVGMVHRMNLPLHKKPRTTKAVV